MSSRSFASQHATHPAKRVTLFVEYSDRSGGRPILFDILRRVRRAKLAGVTVFQGHVGYGLSGHLHHTHLLVEDSPLAIVIVDSPERIDGFVADVDDLLDEVFVVIDDVEVLET
jgi:uncharacterized protein